MREMARKQRAFVYILNQPGLCGRGGLKGKRESVRMGHVKVAQVNLLDSSVAVPHGQLDALQGVVLIVQLEDEAMVKVRSAGVAVHSGALEASLGSGNACHWIVNHVLHWQQSNLRAEEVHLKFGLHIN